jgi:hypothetical protein
VEQRKYTVVNYWSGMRYSSTWNYLFSGMKHLILILSLLSTPAYALDLELGIGIPFVVDGLGTDIRDSRGRLWEPDTHKIGYLGVIWDIGYRTDICICHYSVINDSTDAGVTVLVLKKRFTLF